AGQPRSLSLDDLAHRLEARRVIYFTLLAHQVAWLRPVAQTAERLSMNSGTIDTAHGDIAELTNRLRSWIGVGNEVVALSDQPHRVGELLSEHDLPVTVHESGVHAFRPGTREAGDGLQADSPSAPTEPIAASPSPP